MSLATASTSAIQAALLALGERIAKGAQRVLENAVAAAEQAARSTTAWKDGTKPGPRTRSTIRHSLRGPLSGFVEVGGAGKFLENGTKAHDILPRRGKYLAFKGPGGGMVFSRGVHHPGTKATHFMRDAAEMVRPIFLRNTVAAVNNAVQRFNR